MSQYAGVHGRALDQVRRKGAAVSFTRIRQVHDPETGHVTPTPETVSGHAVRDHGDPLRYQTLGVVESDAVTLLFVPNALGSEVRPGMTGNWAGRKYSVKDVDAIAPDGETIASSVVISR